MQRYNDYQMQNYQIVEMKEETNETSLSLDRSANSDFYVSKLRKTISTKKPINTEQVPSGSGQYISQYLVRQPTTQSVYQPIMFKSGNTIHQTNPVSDVLIPDDMVVSKTYSKFNSLKSPTTPLQGHQILKKQLQFRDGVYSLENPNQLYKQLNEQPYNHSFSLDNKKIESFQSQIDELKSKNSQLETMVSNLKKDLSAFENEKQKNKIMEEKIRELQWKLERQKSQPLPTLKRVMDSDENYLQEINLINLKQENKILKDRVCSLEYDLKLAYSQTQSNLKPSLPPSQLEIENRKFLTLIDELQKQNVEVTDKLMFAQTYKDKYNQLLAENQSLKQTISENDKSSKLFSCYC